MALIQDTNQVDTLFERTEAAQGFEVLPSGSYDAIAEHGEKFQSKNGTPGYKIRFRIQGGAHDGSAVWDDLWLTQKAMPRTKAELAKFGITTAATLNAPIPPGRLCRLVVVQKTADNGWVGNEVKRFEIIKILEPTKDPFAPQELDDNFAAELLASGPDGGGYGN